MGIRNHVKVGTDVQELDVMAEHGNAAGAPVVSGIAVFEGIDPAKFATQTTRDVGQVVTDVVRLMQEVTQLRKDVATLRRRAERQPAAV